MYVKVVNGTVTQTGLPTSGVLNGHTVSNYNLLPADILRSEGWLPLELNRPVYDADTQELRLVGYTVEADKVTANYEVVAKQPTTEDRLSAAEMVIADLINIILTM